jgi:hypothetical protein
MPLNLRAILASVILTTLPTVVGCKQSTGSSTSAAQPSTQRSDSPNPQESAATIAVPTKPSPESAMPWLDLASEQAAKVANSGDYRRSRLFSELAELRIAAGDAIGARRDIGAAQSAANFHDPVEVDRVQAYLALAAVQTKLKDPAALTSLRTAEAIESQSVGDPLFLGRIATAESEAGDIPSAIATAMDLPAGPQKWRVLTEIAYAQAKAGDAVGAEQTAALMSDENWSVAANAMARFGASDVAGGESQLARIAKDEKQSAAYRAAILMLARQANDPAEASSLASKAGTATLRSGAHLQLAQVRTEAGDMSGGRWEAEAAIKSVSEIADAKAKLLFSIEIADVLDRTGDSKGAAALMSGLASTTPLTDRENSMSDRVRASVLARSGETAAALQIAKAMSDPQQGSFAISDIITAEAEAGNVADAKALLVELVDPTVKAIAALAIGKAEAKSGDLAAARVTAAPALHTGGTDDKAYEGLAGAAAQAGRFDDLKTWAYDRDDPSQKCWIYLGAAAEILGVDLEKPR